jgi:CRISPR-associated protein Csd1
VHYTIPPHDYALASSTPILVFGRLIRSAQHDMQLLRRDRFGAFRWAERTLEEILAGLPSSGSYAAFPRRLSLPEQALFALAFYHQRAERVVWRGESTAGTQPRGQEPERSASVQSDEQ